MSNGPFIACLQRRGGTRGPGTQPPKTLPETGMKPSGPRSQGGDSAGRRSDPKRPESSRVPPGIPTGDRKPGPLATTLPPQRPQPRRRGHTPEARGARAARQRPLLSRPDAGPGSAGAATTGRRGERGRRPRSRPPAPPTFRANFSCVLLLKICRTLPLMPSPRTCVVTLWSSMMAFFLICRLDLTWNWGTAAAAAAAPGAGRRRAGAQRGRRAGHGAGGGRHGAAAAAAAGGARRPRAGQHGARGRGAAAGPASGSGRGPRRPRPAARSLGEPASPLGQPPGSAQVAQLRESPMRAAGAAGPAACLPVCRPPQGTRRARRDAGNGARGPGREVAVRRSTQPGAGGRVTAARPATGFQALKGGPRGGARRRWRIGEGGPGGVWACGRGWP